ncbi:MAG: acyl-CoA--6-aminopenicillanic acid acyl-transferase [Clostridiales bacterium]|nr:acyl-CoA--6-aminopenicillanic acid acyl-transferase [Clostridiales bacterium]
MNLPVIEVSGNSYEIGFQYGSKAKKYIDVTINVYKNMFMEFSNINWETAKKIALKFEKDILDFNPEFLQEIRGIADGSGYEYEEILALNVRSELVFQGTHLTSDGCTSLVATSDTTNNKKTYIGQNWDWKVKILGGVVLLKVKKDGKPALATMTEAGIVGKIGMNANGIGVCFNALSVNDTPSGVPIHIILRSILEQETFEMAMNIVSNTKIGCPANIVIASEYGEAIDFEIEIDDFEAIYPKDGILTHTNHYTSLKLPKCNRKDTAKCKFPDTFIRKGRADKIINESARHVTLRDIKSVFTNHTDPSSSICHHEENNGPDGGGIGTVFSIIMDLQEREMHISFGQPCQNPYKKFRI